MGSGRVVLHGGQILCALLCAWIAHGKRRNPIGWGIFGAIVPVLSVIFVLCVGELPDAAAEEAERLRAENRKLREALKPPPGEPPGFTDVLWHAAVDDRSRGPLSFADLKALWSRRAVDAGTLVWTPGMKDWCAIRRIPGMAEALAAA